MRSGAISMALVVSLLAPAVAAQQAPPPPPMVDPAAAPPPVHRSEGMRITGIIFTGLASATLLTGAMLMATDPKLRGSGENDCAEGCVSLLIGAPLMGLSVVFAAVGIPLWVVGSQPPKRAASASPSAFPALLPTVAAGPRGGTLRWSF
jgi:hypothetical protein